MHEDSTVNERVCYQVRMYEDSTVNERVCKQESGGEKREEIKSEIYREKSCMAGK